jgi:hypothetical protein
MSIALTSPITGSAQTGFTAPTYTIVADSPPANNGKQWVVSALGGTQTGVSVNSVSKPFTISFFKPASLRALPPANPLTGVIKSIPMNKYKLIVRKGAAPAANQNPITNSATVEFNVGAGVDSYAAAEIRAMCSVLIGALTQISAGAGDTLSDGVM